MKEKRNAKKAFALFLAFCILLSSAGITAFGDDALANAKEIQKAKQIGDTPYYELSADDTYIPETATSGSLVSKEDGFVKVEKNIEATGTENVFDITLNVMTKKLISAEAAIENAAVVLVLDKSGSMGDAIVSGGITTTRGALLKKSANDFVDQYAANSGGANRMISVVEFSDHANITQMWVDAATAEGEAAVKNTIGKIGAEGSTNIEAALMLARNLIITGKENAPNDSVKGIKDIDKVYVILLTDGHPTNHPSNDPGTAMLGQINGQTNFGVYSKNQKPAYYEAGGNITYYKDYIGVEGNGERKGLAEQIKELNVHLYTISFATGSEIMQRPNETSWWAAIPATSMPMKDWLAQKVASQEQNEQGLTVGMNFDAVNGDALTIAFKNIIELMEKISEAWKVLDPMGDFIVFDREKSNIPETTSNGGINKVYYDAEGLHWDLIGIDPVQVVRENGETTYIYRLKYTVKLDTEAAGFDPDLERYPTNKRTNLTYAITQNNKGDVTLIEGDVDFLIPTVKAAYTVEYAYWVNGVRKEGYTKAENAGWSGWMDGEDYTIGRDKVHTTYLYDGSNYDFAYATNSDRAYPAYTLDAAEDYASGTIDKANVKINLHYIDKSELNVALTKKIKWDSDETLPADFAFTFTLRNEADKEVGMLTMTKDDFVPRLYSASFTGSFIWTSGVTSIRDDLLGQTLRLYEDSESDWNPLSVPAGGIDYVTIGLDGAVKYLPVEGSVPGVIINDYEQAPAPVSIELKKFFEGDLENFTNQGNDGSVLDCTYELQEDIIPDDDDLETHESDIHEHDMNCYKYTFTFTLYDEQGKAIEANDLVLSAAEIIKLNERGKSETVHFTGAPYPEKGAVIYTIKETSAGYEGFTMSRDKKVRVNCLGEVEYFNNKGYAEMTNTFGGEETPGVELSKDVVDGRTGLEKGDFLGTFKFELKDIDTGWTKFVELEMDNGSDGLTIELPEYIGKTATLSLREVPGDDPKFIYDETVYTIYIEDGVAVMEGGRFAEFENIYFEEPAPEIQIIKTTNGEDGVFKFTITDEEGIDEERTIKTVRGIGHGETFFILPPLYTGTVTVKEAQDLADDWVLDDRVFMFTYDEGILTGVSVDGESLDCDSEEATAAFNNNYFGLKIELIKTASAESVKPNTTVNYNLAVINKSTEALSNVEIYDQMLVKYEGEVFVTKVEADSEAETLVEGEDYEFDKSSGIIRLLGDLGVFGKVFVDYTVTFTEAGKYQNEAIVTAIGKETARSTRDDSEKTVIVKSDPVPGPDKPGTGPGTPERPGTPGTTVPDPDVPLEDVPPAIVPEEPEIIPDPDIPLVNIPQTGEAGNVAFDLAMLGLSLSALIALLAKKRKKEESKI